MKLKFFLLAIITMNILSADIQAQTANTDKKKSLVVYYSRRGNNYLNGEIVDLKTGNTEVVANKIQALTGSDIFRIETVKSYPVDYTETTEVAKKEQNDNARPAIRGKSRKYEPV